MKPLYIIPARGGSKGVPRKNIRNLGGKPLIAHTIAAAAEAMKTCGGTLLVSTDDEEIAAVAAQWGAPTAYRRPSELASDTAGSREMMLHAAQWARETGIEFDCIVLLQPTSPLRNVDDILATVNALAADNRADMAVTVCASDDNPYYNLFETDPSGALHICKGDGLYTRRQDAPTVWRYNGAVYAIRPESLAQHSLGELPRRIPVAMPVCRSIDIDSVADFEAAEALLRNANN